MKKFFALILFALFLFAPMVLVLANQISTTMTWFVPQNKTFTLAYGGTCSATAFFFDENRAVLDGDVDGNGAQIAPRPNRLGGTVCQDATTAGMTITNAGNIAISLDGNFASALDTNIWLKVWQGTGAGCGTSGMGGWELRCTTTSTTLDLNAVSCRDFNSSNSTTAARLTTSLPIGDTNQLCFSGDFMAAVLGQSAAVTQGDKNGTFQISSDVS